MDTTTQTDTQLLAALGLKPLSVRGDDLANVVSSYLETGCVTQVQQLASEAADGIVIVAVVVACVTIAFALAIRTRTWED